MRSLIRTSIRTSLIILLITLFPAVCFAKTEVTSDTEDISNLIQRAQQASPKDQCYLYAMVLRNMTELAHQQFQQGNEAGAFITLENIQNYALRLHDSLQPKTKKLKNAELVLHTTSQRLQSLLHNAPSNDQPAVQATLRNVEQVESELMNQVFLH